MVKIKFLKDTKQCKKGQIVNTSKKAAEDTIKEGFAEYVKEVINKEPDFVKTEKQMWENYELYKITKSFRVRNKVYPRKLIPVDYFIFQKTLTEAGFPQSDLKRTLSNHLLSVKELPEDGELITSAWLEKEEKELEKTEEEFELKEYVKDVVFVEDIPITIILKRKSWEVFRDGNIINKFSYDGKITNKIITEFAGVLIGIELFEKVKDAKNWIYANSIFETFYELKIKLDEKVKKIWQEKQVDKSSSVVKAPAVIKVSNYTDNVEMFSTLQPFFYDKSFLFWFWQDKECKWEVVDEIDVMNAIDQQLVLGGETVTSSVKSSYLEAFKRVGRKNMPKIPPKCWVQFKDTLFDIDTRKEFKSTPEFFNCNPVPWELGESSETPRMDELFKQWVGEEYVQTLYEIIAYCCITDYPIHVLFCFIGSGRNGKSRFQALLTKFIGKENICSTELDILVESRFESFKLFKKLVCSLGETNFGVLDKTSMLKKLTGQDLIGFEVKNKGLFDDLNYAKILINSNSLPSSEDTSEGFYRRWLIIDFPNKFPEGKDILVTVPDFEFNNLARKVCEILPVLLERGCFTNQGTLKERENRYIMASNPFPLFLQNYCSKSSELFIRYSELYTSYMAYLKKMNRRIVSRKEFTNALTSEGIEMRKTSKKLGENNFESGLWAEGVSLNEQYRAFMLDVPVMTESSTNPPPRELSENLSITSTTSTTGLYYQNSKSPQEMKVGGGSFPMEPIKTKENNEIIHHKCHFCQQTPCVSWHRNKPVCQDCKLSLEKNNLCDEEEEIK